MLAPYLSVNMLTQYLPWRSTGIDVAGHEICSGDTIDSGHAGNCVCPGPDLRWAPRQLAEPRRRRGTTFERPRISGSWIRFRFRILFCPSGSLPPLLSSSPGIVAIGGTFLFLRRLSFGRPAAWLAGFIFATSGFMVVWTNWPQTRVAAFIPALFWAEERLIQRKKPIDIAILAVVVASMLLGGFPSVTGYALYLGAGYLLVRLWLLRGRAIRTAMTTAAMAAGGLVLGILLSAVQIVPFYYFYNHADLSYRTGDAHQGLPLSGLLTLVVPNANGLCIAGQPTHGLVSPIELVAYAGAAALVLAIAGAAFGFGMWSDSLRRSLLGYFLVAAIVVVVLAWVSPTARSLVASLPAFSGNFIGRVRSVLGFGVAVLAAVGFEWLTAKRPGSRTSGRPPPPAAHAVGGGRLAGGRAGQRSSSSGRNTREAFSGGYWSDVRRAIWIPALLVGVSVAALVVSRLRGRGAQTLAFVVLPLLVVTQGVQFFHAVLPGDNSNNFYPNTPTHQFLKSHLGNERFASSGMTMYPSTALYYGLRTPTGHAFLEPDWKALLVQVDPSVMLSATLSDFSASLNQNTIGRQPILDRMGVKYFVLPPEGIAGTIEPPPPATGAVSDANGPISCTLPGQPLRGVSVRLAGLAAGE